MTKKDYELIAKVFAQTEPDDDATSAYHLQWRGMRHEMAAALAAENPRFGREKFVSACKEV